MTVSKFEQPDFTAQDAATYKANIDNSIDVLAQTGKQFAPREMATPAMGVTFEAGLLMDGTVVPAQNLTGIGAPTTNPRIDRVYYDLNLRSFQRVTGTEAATPTPPALPFGVFPVCSIYLVVGQTAIRNADLTDDRTMIIAPAAFFAGDGYTSIVDAAGLLRMIIGKAGVDNRFITRLHNDTDAKFVIQNSSGADVANVDATGKATFKSYMLTSTVGFFSGTGSPEGAVTAGIGSIYSRTDGGAATSFYVKESGTGNTGWVAK
ncbi:hypothetical protein FDJ62_gp21 [Acinetobacter phage Loki]|uniref:Uncharacterized protein n=1 Tax=Acinetobacter phage Loki TaxID=1970374 RepID=A0A0P1KLE3_9CAUD|nr:hypothetical protein FDJ62_gp21 [Acinetobacter phage Loki]CUS06482.1 hypothetical protein [Acinetobacter phage Loki]